VTASKQTTVGGDSGGYTTEYAYNLSGALIEETYPSSRKVQNVLDATDRVRPAFDQKVNVVGHQAVGVQKERELLFYLGKECQEF